MSSPVVASHSTRSVTFRRASPSFSRTKLRTSFSLSAMARNSAMLRFSRLFAVDLLQALEEELDPDPQNARDLQKTACTNPIGAFLVFLNLLECEA